MSLFSEYNQVEKELLETYTQMLLTHGAGSVSEAEARRAVKMLLDEAIRESKRDRTYNLPRNFGNIILKEEKAEDPVVEKLAERIRKNLPKRRAEGVRDEDIKWLWNLNDIDRRMMSKNDIMIKAIFLEGFKAKGLTSEEASARIRKIQPIYGDLEDTSHTQGDDSPLPYELMDRISDYNYRQAQENLAKLREELKSYSSFNALIRREIRAGSL